MSKQRLESDFGKVVEPGVVRFERVLPGPIERIWTFLTDSEQRGKWFGSGPMELRPGGKVELIIRHGDLSPVQEERPAKIIQEEYRSAGMVLRCEPPRLLSFTWGEGAESSDVTFELAPCGNEVVLTLTHSRLSSREEMVNVASGWHTHLGVLADQANDRTPGGFWSAFEGIEEEYDRRFPRD